MLKREHLILKRVEALCVKLEVMLIFEKSFSISKILNNES